MFVIRAIVISCILGKGGGGKTSLLTNLTGVLMRHEYKVLNVDLDSQGNISDAFGLDESKYTALNMFYNKVNTADMITRYNSHLDVIQAHEDMGTLELDLLSKLSRYDDPFNFVKPHIEALRGSYDFIFLDSPPSLGLTVGNALASSDFVLIPFVPEPFAIKGLKRVIKAVKDFRAAGSKVEILAVVPMFVEIRTKLHTDLMQQARQYCEKQSVFMTDTVIPHSIKFANATAYENKPATLGRDRNNEIVSKYYDLWEDDLRNELQRAIK